MPLSIAFWWLTVACYMCHIRRQPCHPSGVIWRNRSLETATAPPVITQRATPDTDDTSPYSKGGETRRRRPVCAPYLLCRGGTDYDSRIRRSAHPRATRGRYGGNPFRCARRPLR